MSEKLALQRKKICRNLFKGQKPTSQGHMVMILPHLIEYLCQIWTRYDNMYTSVSFNNLSHLKSDIFTPVIYTD